MSIIAAEMIVCLVRNKRGMPRQTGRAELSQRDSLSWGGSRGGFHAGGACPPHKSGPGLAHWTGNTRAQTQHTSRTICTIFSVPSTVPTAHETRSTRFLTSPSRIRHESPNRGSGQIIRPRVPKVNPKLTEDHFQLGLHCPLSYPMKYGQFPEKALGYSGQAC